MAEAPAAEGGAAPSPEPAPEAPAASGSDSAPASSGGEPASDQSTGDPAPAETTSETEAAPNPEPSSEESTGETSHAPASPDPAAENGDASGEQSAEPERPQSGEKQAADDGTTTAEQSAEPEKPEADAEQTADDDAAPGEPAEGQGAAATAGKNGAKQPEGAEQAGATAAAESQGSVEQQVLAAVPPPDPAPLYELRDQWNSVSADGQQARDEVRRQGKDMPTVWGDEGGAAMESRIEKAAQDTDDIAREATAISERTSVTAGDFADARTQMVNRAQQADHDVRLAAALLPSQAETEVAVKQVTASAIEDNTALNTAVQNKVADDWYDNLDIYRKNPGMNWVKWKMDQAMDGLKEIGERTFTAESEGPDAGITFKGPSPGGGVVNVEGNAVVDRGKWHAFDDSLNGEYSAGLYGSSKLNLPGSEDPLIEADVQLGARANLDKTPMTEIGPFSVSMQPEVRVGPGATLVIDPKMENGDFKLNARIGASPIVGGGLGLDLKVDPDELARSLESIRRGIFG